MKTNAKFILSKKETIKQFKIAQSHSDIVSYSNKTNRDVGKILRNNTNCFFSVHTIPSLSSLNCPNRIWFFAQAWDKEEIETIIQKGIRMFVVDNINDLNLLIDFIKKKNIKIELLLRMRLKENTIHTGKHFVFGMFSKTIIELIPNLKQNKLITKLGIHFHRKTQNISEWSLQYELEQIIPKNILKEINYVNIGGGIPSKYKNFRAEVIDQIFKKIDEFKGWLNKFDIKMIIEPGRFIAAPPIKLQAEIMNIYDYNIILNCSIYAGAMDTFVSHIRLEVEGELDRLDASENSDVHAYTIKGKTPDSVDIYRYRVYLKEPKIGDKITFLNAGAYTYATDFCGLNKPEVVVIE